MRRQFAASFPVSSPALPGDLGMGLVCLVHEKREGCYRLRIDQGIEFFIVREKWPLKVQSGNFMLSQGKFSGGYGKLIEVDWKKHLGSL